MGVYGASGPATLQRVDLEMALMGTNEMAEREGLIGTILAPEIFVGRKLGAFPVVDMNQINQKLVNDERAPGGRFNELSATFRSDSYNTKFYGLQGSLDRQEQEIYVDDVEQDTILAEAIMVNILKNKEKRILALAQAVSATTGSGGQPAAPSTVWTSASSTPVTDMITYKLALRNRRRRFRNTDLVLGLDYEVVEKLRINSEILNKLSTMVQKLPSDIDNGLIAAALGVGRIAIANSWENLSSQGAAEADTSYELQWPKAQGFLCIAKATKGEVHRWANVLKWRKGITGWEQSYDWDCDADKIRYREAYGLKEVDSGSALRITGVAA
jgi:hypothetical protein